MGVLKRMGMGLTGLAMAGSLGGAASAQPAATAVDPQRVALAEQIYAMIGQQTVQGVGRALTAMMSSTMRGVSGQDPARGAAMQAALGDSLTILTPQVLHSTARIMAEDFTTEQLRGILAFYLSPTGQALLQKTPLITRQALQVSTSLLPGFLETFEADYCRRVSCTEPEKDAFAQVNVRMAQAARMSAAQASAPQAAAPHSSAADTPAAVH